MRCAGAQAVDDVGHFLAHGRRRGRLAVGAAHHRHCIGQFVRQFAQAGDDLSSAGSMHRRRARPSASARGQVVDVFRGAGEVDEFADLDHFGVVGQLLLDPVFERLDVVVGRALPRSTAKKGRSR
jgi:hypothetical protein